MHKENYSVAFLS